MSDPAPLAKAGRYSALGELLVVDDEERLRRWSERVLRDHGYHCEGAANAAAARESLKDVAYQLALLDINMPGESGMQLLSFVRSEYPDCAVVMVTGEDSVKLATSAIEHGAYGYLIKPVGAGELLINVANALHRRRLELESHQLMERLERVAADRGQRMERALEDLRLAETRMSVTQEVMIFRLASLVEFRDEETARHLKRISTYCQILAAKIGLPAEECELIGLASQLHDVGKAAIPASILLKRGTLTDEEFKTIKSHTEMGYRMLCDSTSEVVLLGALIARTHHEHWDGGGYPYGLAGKAIPLEGRIAAIADVFDALTSNCVYRPAFPLKIAVKKMQFDRGTHFDPDLLDAFISAMPEVQAARLEHQI